MLIEKMATCVQLDWAIKLLVNENAALPAITLAAAAEEIIIKNRDDSNAYHELKRTLIEDHHFTDKEAHSLLNGTKNLLKHWSTTDDSVELDLETEAVGQIIRGLINMIRYDQSIPSQMPLFVDWLMKHRVDLIAEIDFLNSWTETKARIGI